MGEKSKKPRSLLAPPPPRGGRGEGWGEGEQLQGLSQLPDFKAPLSLTLMEQLAIRLSPQAGKSLVISHKGRGDLLTWTLSARWHAQMGVP